MKINIKTITRTAVLCLLLINFQLVAQSVPNNEINCFDNFEYNDSGNNLVNTYLLAMLNYKMTPHNLLGLESGSAAEAVALSKNNSEFEIEFKSRLEKWFNPNKHSAVIKILRNVKTVNHQQKNSKPSNARTRRTSPRGKLTATGSNEKEKLVIEFFYESNGRGIDPEAMLISTKEYIIVAWRGTDRVSNTAPIVGDAFYEFGEWVETNPNMRLVPPPSSISGRVHAGFDRSVRYGDILGKLARRLRLLGVENKKLWITGHSLGGAHAQLSALYLKKMYNIQPFAVYAYASPAVGDQALANTLEQVLSGTKLQRFIYGYDPVPRLPSGMTLPYARAGILNYYSSEQGSNNYHFDKSEQREFPSPFMCHHHSQWYARAAYFELIDNQPSLNSKIPEAPPTPTEFCSPVDKLLGDNASNIIQSFFGIDQDMEAGTYYIMNAKTRKYLNIKAGETNSDGRPFRMGSLNNSNRFKWKVENIPAGVLGGYVIKCKSGSKVIDADRSNVGEANSGVQTWSRLPAIVGILRNHQEWEIERLDNGKFHIKNMLNNQYILKALDNRRVVLDRNDGLRSEWFLIKVAN